MAGEKIEVIKGPVVTIRAVAKAKAEAGDYAYIGRTPGFWLHDTAKGETGDLCISAPIVDIPNGPTKNPKKHAAGDVFLGVVDGIDYAPKTAALQTKTPAHTHIVYRAVKGTDARVLVVWGLY